MGLQSGNDYKKVVKHTDTVLFFMRQQNFIKFKHLNIFIFWMDYLLVCSSLNVDKYPLDFIKIAEKLRKLTLKEFPYKKDKHQQHSLSTLHRTLTASAFQLTRCVEYF